MFDPTQESDAHKRYTKSQPRKTEREYHNAISLGLTQTIKNTMMQLKSIIPKRENIL